MKLSVFFLYLIRLAEQENWTLETAVKYVKDLGYTAIDIDKDEIDAYPDALELFKKHRLIVRNVYGAYDLISGKDADATELIDYAVKSGAKVVMLLAGLFDNDEITSFMKENEQAMVEFLEKNKKAKRTLLAIRRTAEYAKEKGVTLTIESFGSPNSITSYISQIKWLIDNADGLKFTFDIGNFYLNGQDVFYAYQLFKDHSVHVHCKDYLIEPKVGSNEFSYAKISVPVGEGKAPTKEIVNNFLSNGYDGYFTVEYLGVENVKSILERSAKYMLSLR